MCTPTNMAGVSLRQCNAAWYIGGLKMRDIYHRWLGYSIDPTSVHRGMFGRQLLTPGVSEVTQKLLGYSIDTTAVQRGMLSRRRLAPVRASEGAKYAP